jgi:hypothetical protein
VRSTAGGQAAQAAIAEARFRFHGDELIQVLAEALQRFPDLIADTEIEQRIAQVGPQQVLGGQVSHHPGGIIQQRIGRTVPAMHQTVANGIGHCPIVVRLGRDPGDIATAVEQVVLDSTAQGIDVHPGPVVLYDDGFLLWHH